MGISSLILESRVKLNDWDLLFLILRSRTIVIVRVLNIFIVSLDTAYININRDSFFNFGILDDYNHMGFKYSTFSITTYVSGDSFFYFWNPR